MMKCSMRLTDNHLSSLILPKQLVRLDFDVNGNDHITDKTTKLLAVDLPPRLESFTVNFDLCNEVP